MGEVAMLGTGRFLDVMDYASASQQGSSHRRQHWSEIGPTLKEIIWSMSRGEKIMRGYVNTIAEGVGD